MHLLTRFGFSDRASALWLITPGLLLGALFFYGFLAWTAWLSLTRSGMLPSHEFVGLLQYQRLFEDPRWLAALWNLLRFASLFVALPLLIGLGLAVLLDQKLRAEGVLRWIYLHPMALSMIVTGSAWRWLMDPDQGLAEGLQVVASGTEKQHKAQVRMQQLAGQLFSGLPWIGGLGHGADYAFTVVHRWFPL